jgi:hypothetical protein
MTVNEALGYAGSVIDMLGLTPFIGAIMVVAVVRAVIGMFNRD